MKKRIVSWVFNGIIVIAILLYLIGSIGSGNIKVVGESKDNVDKINFFEEDYITDYNYEPTEKDMLRHTLRALHKLDKHKWGEVDDLFMSQYVMEAELREAYVAEGIDPEKIEEIAYTVKNKEYKAYLEEIGEVSPIDYKYSDGVRWATFPYDVWVRFTFDLTRVIHLEDGSTEKDVFQVAGEYPPQWIPDQGETYWRLGGLMFKSEAN